MTNTIEISGSLLKKVNTVTKTNVTINPSKDFTEYTEQQILVAASGSESINLGGIVNPTFLYIDTDNAITFKSYRGASVIASAIAVDSNMLLTCNEANRFGTVTLANIGASPADVNIYVAG